MGNPLFDVVMARSRARKLEHFFSLCPPGTSVLDVGVSKPRDRARHGHGNYFLKHFPNDRAYTGLGIEDISGLRETFPGKAFVQYDGNVFPFGDNTFDWVFSNAVIEHVRDAPLFLREMLRVGRHVFFTTPNKFFPLEAHTNLLFVHWSDRLFDHWKVSHGRDPRSINLFSHRALRALLDQSKAQYQVIRNRTLGATMTFTVVASS